MLRSYHVTDRGKGYSDDDESEGSRSFPSRTRYGAAFAAAEKWQWLVAPRYFLFGMIRVPMFEYRCGMTIAQIELMQYDQPFTAYKRRDPNEGKKPGDPGYKPDAEKLKASVEKWKKRKAEREKRGWSLEKFLRTGEKVPTEHKE